MSHRLQWSRALLLERLEEISVHWYAYSAHFFGGAFLSDPLPHLIAGVSGRNLQTPFASPAFRGLSSPLVNVGWALANLGVAYLLLVRVDRLDLQAWAYVGVCFAGFGLLAPQCARAFEKLRSEMAG
jgi:hypothetical protein